MRTYRARCAAPDRLRLPTCGVVRVVCARSTPSPTLAAQGLRPQGRLWGEPVRGGMGSGVDGETLAPEAARQLRHGPYGR